MRPLNDDDTEILASTRFQPKSAEEYRGTGGVPLWDTPCEDRQTRVEVISLPVSTLLHRDVVRPSLDAMFVRRSDTPLDNKDLIPSRRRYSRKAGATSNGSVLGELVLPEIPKYVARCFL